MAPSPDDTICLVSSPESSLIITPPGITPSNTNSYSSLSSDSDSGVQADQNNVSLLDRIRLPLEQNLKELLEQVTGSKNLETINEIKLRVIAREVSLQHLSIHMPLLRELNLDGSIVSSLRDLGCGMKNLKILRVCHCGLTCLDGIFGLEGLEEFYLANNFLTDASQCAFLPEIRIIDLKNNDLKNISKLSFLSMCAKLEHVYLEGNKEIVKFPKYRQTVKALLPVLKTLDGIEFSKDECSKEFGDVDEKELEEYLVCTVDEQPITDYYELLEKTGFLPPINSTAASTTNSNSSSNGNGMLKSSSSDNEKFQKNELPEIFQQNELAKSVPSKLTSGAPICGNVAAAFRNRKKTQDALVEKN